jgi:hypothetical protein
MIAEKSSQQGITLDLGVNAETGSELFSPCMK